MPDFAPVPRRPLFRYNKPPTLMPHAQPVDPFAVTGRKKVDVSPLHARAWRLILLAAAGSAAAWLIQTLFGTGRFLPVAAATAALLIAWAAAVRLLFLDMKGRGFWGLWLAVGAVFALASPAGSGLWIAGTSFSGVFLVFRRFRPFSHLSHRSRARVFFVSLAAWSALTWAWFVGGRAVFTAPSQAVGIPDQPPPLCLDRSADLLDAGPAASVLQSPPPRRPHPAQAGRVHPAHRRRPLCLAGDHGRRHRPQRRGRDPGRPGRPDAPGLGRDVLRHSRPRARPVRALVRSRSGRRGGERGQRCLPGGRIMSPPPRRPAMSRPSPPGPRPRASSSASATKSGASVAMRGAGRPAAFASTRAFWPAWPASSMPTSSSP